MSELKPCPFCGGPAMVTNPTMWQAWCTKCHSIGEPRLTKEEAIEAWNRRTNSTTIQPSAHPEIIRCRECKFASGDSRICMKFDHSPIGELDFCSFAERREVTT